jgi:hypothetical protein
MKRLIAILLVVFCLLPAALGQVAGGAPVFSGPSGSGTAVITTNEFDASAIVSGTLDPDRIGSSTNQYLKTPTIDAATFTGNNSFETITAINLVGNGGGLTNLNAIAKTNGTHYGHLTFGSVEVSSSIVWNDRDLSLNPITRYANAIDLQQARNAAWQTATDGNYIFGGANNVADSIFGSALIIGGTGNTNQGNDTVIVTGGGNFTDAIDSIIGSGRRNIMSGADAGILAGSENKVFYNHAFIGAGATNEIYLTSGTESYGAILAGHGNTVGGVGEMAIGSRIQTTNNYAVNLGYYTNAAIVNSNGVVSMAAIRVRGGTSTNAALFTRSGLSAWTLDTPYTNNSRRAFVEGTFNAVNILGIGDIAYVYLLVDQDHSGGYEETDKRFGAQDGTITISGTLGTWLQPNARFMFAQTNAELGTVESIGGRLTEF